MRLFTARTYWLALLAATLLSLPCFARTDERPDRHGFVRLFDGKTLNGWVVANGAPRAYVPDNGILLCYLDDGNPFTEKEYSDFIFRFEFKLDHAANNGIGIRAPLQGDAAYV